MFDTVYGIILIVTEDQVFMDHKAVIEKWLVNTPVDEPVNKVKTILRRVFGEDAICKKTGDSHQLRVKHPLLKDVPGFDPYGYLSIPVHKGQRVKGIYLKRIAHAAMIIYEANQEEKG
ncbi:MAG TPA: hypothetical protein PLU88_11470 [Armatimonadota bacterium]|nr:hypothetical protein [Armatimonadota bacterium]